MPRPGYESVVLVTGFPSFLAQKLVLHLVRDEPRTLVFTLVPPAQVVEARHVVDSLDLADRQRIVLLEGDPTSIDLGLSGAELRQLGREVDRMHHAAYASDLDVDRKAAESLNVVGTGELIEVAKLMTALRCLVFHSTAFVSGDTKGTVYEEDLPEGASYRSAVEETRAKAERLVRHAAKHLPIAIVRPSMIVGDSGTGEVDKLDLPYLFVLLLLAAPADLALPIGARGDVPLHLVPVDFVVRAASAISRDPRAPGRTFHLVDPSPLPVRRFVEMIHDIRERRASWVELSTLARSMLRTPGIEGYLRSPKSLIDQILTNVRYDAHGADEILGPLGIACPPVESYAEKIVAAVEERLVGPTGPLSKQGRAGPLSGRPGPLSGGRPVPASWRVNPAQDDAPKEEQGDDAPSHDADAMD